MKKTLRYNYRLKPTAEQEVKLVEFGAYARGVWNLLLSENMRRYRYDKTFLFYNEMASLIKDLKMFDEFSWLKDFDSAASQQVARDLETALKNSFNKGRVQKFPTFKVSFKQKKLHDDSYRSVNTNENIRLENNGITIPKIGTVKIALHRKLKSKIKSATFKMRHGKWYVSLTQKVECKSKKQVLSTLVGYDINSQYTVVGSNGLYVENPKVFKKSSTKLKQIQVQLSRRKKGSNRWHKTKSRLNKIHGKISSQRLAFAHEVSCSIAKSSDIIVFEDLNVKGMQQFNGQMVNDNVMGMITELTRYKAELNGVVYHEIGRFVKSSGICYGCKYEHKFDLSVREFSCVSCGLVQCRDLAAAKSVADTGEKELIANGILARALPKFQQKSPSKMKVFELSKFGVGSEKKEAA
ncbi:MULTISPECIES: RNA-guided endonuclease TnpB family protein [unclassified Colwellia]|jgi:putative transposase|uniref:RNA-guided endonuclease InsQ/TnpB family protein n=5 Tax=Colwellia TaxID=28228 RepID=UPI0015F74316|nr:MULTISPECIES: RNA-guided endonuclease TnpB family protein [unclassified Colwellia]MBA6353507.1 transposase [Colwellia sp. BRX9-1]MBA6356286.1 transposase [Colwellia sp. BRX8-3]MBA6360113.1 transposase [Colwellia sp. BRX8-6]MBA6384758.1 transposase [Colwellia sp. BRX10-9]MBA6395092.1 transposase [Colwellia sp. BRX10-6]